MKLFKSSEKSRVTPVAELLESKPHALNPCRTNMWTANIGNIEPFVVADFSPPSIVRARNVELDTEVTIFTSTHLSFYDVVGSSVVAQLAALMNGQPVDLSIKILDQLGSIVEIWKMVVHPVAIHPLMMLDYDRAEVMKWQLECECSKWDIQVIDQHENQGTVN